MKQDLIKKMLLRCTTTIFPPVHKKSLNVAFFIKRYKVKESLNLPSHTNKAPGSNEIWLASYEFSRLLFDHAPSSPSQLR